MRRFLAECLPAFLSMKTFLRILFLLLLLTTSGFAENSNCVVNLSHYDLMRPDFIRMKAEGIVGIIHEASYPRFDRDGYYRGRQQAAVQAGLLWGAYHYGDATDPVRQADHFLNTVADSYPHITGMRPSPVLLVLDFEKNGHYPGGTMRVDQAAAFAQRIYERTGKYPGIYSNEYRIQQVLNDRAVSLPQKRILTRCWLWIANYHYEPRGTGLWSHWHLWQYTGDGKCDLPRNGFPKSVANMRKAERNIFRGTRAELESFWVENGWLPGEKVAER
jgi:lysozyme